jgi:glycosyltransferase involved in cell wall biosynthesis
MNCPATRNQASAGLINHDVNGLLVPPGDAAALAAAISGIRGDPGTAARLAAVPRTAQRCTWPALARQVAAIYQQVSRRTKAG